MNETTLLLQAARDGDARAADALFSRVYDELRRLARGRLGAEPGSVTLTATGLVHEAYLKLVGSGGWADRDHFMALASTAMRQVLVDRARARQCLKRGGGARPATLLDDRVAADDAPDQDILAVDDALDRLAQHDARLARLVELRFFGGLEVDEAARVLGVSERTAARLWVRARAHLHTFFDAT